LKEAIKKGKEGPKPESTASEPAQKVKPPSQQQQQQQQQFLTHQVESRLPGTMESRTEILVPVSEFSVSILKP
jgi:hypothetical protein